MKYLTLLFSLSLLVFTSCKKDTFVNNVPNDTIVDIDKLEILTTLPVIQNDSLLKTGGMVSVDLSIHSNLVFGVCYGENPSPTVNNDKVEGFNSQGGVFEVLIDYVDFYSKPMYLRAYVKDIHTNSIKYGNELVFDKNALPEDITNDITKAIIETLDAVENGRLKITTGGTINMDLTKLIDYEFGVCYGLQTIPTISQSTSSPSLTNSIQNFTSEIEFENPTYNQIYYIRAYVKEKSTNEVYYGDIKSYTVIPQEPLFDHVYGDLTGRHFWQIPDILLQRFSDSIPLDENGNKTNLVDGILDTLTFVYNDNGNVSIFSKSYNIELKGKLVGDNIIKIDSNRYSTVKYKGLIMEDVIIKSLEDFTISSQTSNTIENIHLRFSVKKIASISILTYFDTKGMFERK